MSVFIRFREHVHGAQPYPVMCDGCGRTWTLSSRQRLKRCPDCDRRQARHPWGDSFLLGHRGRYVIATRGFVYVPH